MLCMESQILSVALYNSPSIARNAPPLRHKRVTLEETLVFWLAKKIGSQLRGRSSGTAGWMFVLHEVVPSSGPGISYSLSPPVVITESRVRMSFPEHHQVLRWCSATWKVHLASSRPEFFSHYLVSWTPPGPGKQRKKLIILLKSNVNH